MEVLTGLTVCSDDEWMTPPLQKVLQGKGPQYGDNDKSTVRPPIPHIDPARHVSTNAVLPPHVDSHVIGRETQTHLVDLCLTTPAILGVVELNTSPGVFDM